MADNGGAEGDLVFCHSCQNEWARDRHGLQCPECQSDFVEVVSLCVFYLRHRAFLMALTD